MSCAFCFDPLRPLSQKRVSTEARDARIESPLAKAILEGKFASEDTVKVDCKGRVMRFDEG